MEKRRGCKRTKAVPSIVLGVACALLLWLVRRLNLSAAVINGIPFAFSDILVIVPAGIGGVGCGLVTFSVLFIIEFVENSGNYIAVYSISTYLVLALVAGFSAYWGWYRNIRKMAAFCLLIVLILATAWYVTFTVALPEQLDNIFHGVGYSHLMLGALPESVISTLLIALYFRFAPDRIKSLLGSGWAYTEGRDGKTRRNQVLGTRIAIISLAETLFLCLIAVLCENVFYATDNEIQLSLPFMASRWRTSIRMGLVILCAGVPVAYLFNLYIMTHVVRPINTLSHTMDQYFQEEERCRSRELPELDIHSGDEIERLYHSLQKMVGDMGDYIDRELEQERKSAHLTKGFMMALAKAVDAKDHYTSGHSARVAKYSREIARRMGKTEKEQEDIFTMGLLHDIGKIGVSEAIINKNGKLTDEEFAEIKKHPVMGSEILKNVEELPGLAVGARWHHERFDGRGYPDRLEGKNIPEEARIIAVADAYDAMTSNRAYSSVRPQEVVRAEIVQCSGTQFDPDIAKVFLGMIDDDKEYVMHE